MKVKVEDILANPLPWVGLEVEVYGCIAITIIGCIPYVSDSGQAFVDGIRMRVDSADLFRRFNEADGVMPLAGGPFEFSECCLISGLLGMKDDKPFIEKVNRLVVLVGDEYIPVNIV